MKPLKFEHRIIDPHPNGTKHDICLVGDISGSGLPDVVMASKYGEDNLVWYENPGWRRHVMGTAHLEAGGVLVDVNGNGRPDVVAGCPKDAPAGYTNTGLFWFECPENPKEKWRAHVITDRFMKYHDQDVGDVDGDGEPEIVFASQGAAVVGYFDIPADPGSSPWPEECCHIISDGLALEGVKAVDLDGDGRVEVIAGAGYFERDSAGSWTRVDFPVELDPRTLAAAGDLSGDGSVDVVLSEGELDSARIVLLRAPDWKPVVLGEEFYHPHSLELADFDGSGLPDVFVAEMGLRGFATPREVIFRNRGDGSFEMEVVAHLPTHGAKVADMTGDGRLDIVGKPFHAARDQIDLLLNVTE